MLTRCFADAFGVPATPRLPCSIEELRVPDHSHLNIPPEMQAAAAAASGGSSGSRTSTDTGAAGSSDSSGSSTPRASSRDSDSSSKAASKPPQSIGSKALNINFSASSAHRSPNSRASRYSSNSPSPTTQWSSLASTPAPAFLGNSCSSPEGYCNTAVTTASALEHQRAVLQLQQCQMRAQGLSPAGSMYEQQLQHMLLAAQAESAQAQQQVQLMMLQQNQQAAAWGAHLARSSMGSVKGASPPLSPVPSGLMADAPASYGGGDSRSYFVPPSQASSNSASAMAAAQAGWQSAALMRSMSIPANAGSGSLGSNLMRQSSAFGGMFNFASSNGVAVQMQNSAGSSIDGQQDMTLASLLAASSQGLPADTQSWGAGAATPSMSLGMATSAGLPLGCGSSGSGMGGYLGSGTGLDATASLLLLQQQQQQKAALGNAVNLLQSMNGGQMGNGGGQAVNDMLGMMMQQLMLQQQSAVM